MRNFSIFFLFLFLSLTTWGQVLETSDSFSEKLAETGISFIAPKSEVTALNNRSRTTNCEVNTELEAHASYLVKKDKSSFFVVYRLKPLNTFGKRYSKAENSFADIACNNAVSALSEKEFSEIIPLSNVQINEALNADWVRISSFPLQKKWKECFGRTHCYHVFAFKAGNGYCEIMIFFDEASKTFIDDEMPNIMTSIYFTKP